MGPSLDEIVKHDNSSSGVPIIVEKTIEQIEQRGLEEEGIFRISGSTPQVSMVKSQIEKTDETSTQTNDQNTTSSSTTLTTTTPTSNDSKVETSKKIEEIPQDTKDDNSTKSSTSTTSTTATTFEKKRRIKP